DHAGRDAANRFPRRSTPAAAPIAYAVLRLIGEIRVGWAKLFGMIDIIFRPRIPVTDKNRNRRSQGFTFENARENFATIFFFPLRCNCALAWTSSIQRGLNVCVGDIDLRRAAIDHSADSAAV